MHTSFYFLLHFVLLYYYIIEKRFWGAYIVLASAIVQSSLNKYVYTKIAPSIPVKITRKRCDTLVSICNILVLM